MEVIFLVGEVDTVAHVNSLSAWKKVFLTFFSENSIKL